MSKDEQLQVAFLYLKQANDLKVTWNGQEIPLTDPGPDYPEGWKPPQGLDSINSIEAHWLDPLTGKVYRNKTVFANGLHASLFPLTIAADSEGVLIVSYHQSSTACDQCNDRNKRIYHFTYLLSPARYWSSFGELTIKVIGPSNYSIATEPKLTEAGNDNGYPVFTKHFTGLPNGEFHLSIKENMETATSTKILPILGAMIFILLVGLAVFVKRGKRTKKQ